MNDVLVVLYNNSIILKEESRMTSTTEERFKSMLMKAYNKLIAKHGRKAELINQLNKFFPEMEKDYEFMNNASYRISNNSAHSINDSHRELSQRSKSDISSIQIDYKYFNCDWVFKTQDMTKIVFFVIVVGLIVNQDVFKFQLLQNQINDYLSDHNVINPVIMGSITRYWQKMKELFNQNKSHKWQQSLKDLVDKFPKEFTTIACNQFIGASINVEKGLQKNLIAKVVKEINTNITTFTINFKDVEKVQKYGNFGVDIYFGYFKQERMYVISNKLPEISPEEIKMKKLAEVIHKNIKQILSEYYTDNEQIVLPEVASPQSQVHNRKIKQFLGKKASELGLD